MVDFRRRFLIEAERHAIWKSREGMYIDITPCTSGLSNLLFIEEELEYSGQLIDNIRINKTQNSVVDDWIAICTVKGQKY